MGKYQEHILSAQMGDIIAQYEVGYAYLTGDGIPKDYAQAHEWFALSDKSGYSDAALEIGNLYYYGLGVQKDIPKAKSFYEKASESKNILGSLLAGKSYQRTTPLFFDLPGQTPQTGFIYEALSKLDLIRTDKTKESFYESIAMYLKEDPSLFKKKLAKYIIDNEKKYRGYFEAAAQFYAYVHELRGDEIFPGLREEDQKNEYSGKQSEESKNTKTGSTQIAIEAIQSFLNAQLFIVTKTNDPSLYKLNPGLRNSPIFIFYNPSLDYYDSFIIKHQSSREEILKIREKYLNIQVQSNRSIQDGSAHLYQRIRKKEEDHRKLYEKIERGGGGGAEIFKNSSFEDKLAYFGLKNELAHLYLFAAKLAKKHGGESAHGNLIFKSFFYNPFLHPEFSRYEYLPIVPATAHRSLIGSAAMWVGGFVTFNATIYVTIASISSFPIFFALNNILALPLQTAYVKAYCLDDIANHYSAKDCINLAVSYLFQHDIYLSIRYLLEANNRSNEYAPEIDYLMDLCKNDFYSRFDRYVESSHIFEININLIYNKVTSNNNPSRRMKSLLTYSGKLSYNRYSMAPLHRCIFGSGRQDQSNHYFITIPEIVKAFRIGFYEKFPHLTPVRHEEGKHEGMRNADPKSHEANFNLVFPSTYARNRKYWGFDKGDRFTDTMPLRELLAYINKLTPVPREHIELSLASQSIDDAHPDAENYLNGLLEANSEIPLSNLNHSNFSQIVITEDEYLENLLLLIDNHAYIDCEVLQESSFSTYWIKLHLKATHHINIGGIPLNLRNPITHIKEYIDRHLPEHLEINEFFRRLVGDGSDIKTKLLEAEKFNVSSYRNERKIFHSMIMTLGIIADNDLAKVESFIEEYRLFNGISSPKEVVLAANVL